MPDVSHKLFDPKSTHRAEQKPPTIAIVGDRADPQAYVFEDHIVLAVNVALATGRPILVRGPTGSGKSTLAPAVAERLGWSYASVVVTSRTSARDLLWRVDQLRRLQDAQLGQLSADESRYVTPGPLFWAFAPDAAWSLMERTGRAGQAPSGIYRECEGTVVLVDEIDKADPDVPNNLLEALGSLSFTVEDLSLTVAAAKAPLTFVTTNEERDLPAAFLRRCVALRIAASNAERLVAIGRAHLPELSSALLEGVAQLVVERSREQGSQASAAEFLDTLRACRALNIVPYSDEFQQLARMTLWKAEDTEEDWA